MLPLGFAWELSRRGRGEQRSAGTGRESGAAAHSPGAAGGNESV